jgi:hypothetical protein
MAFKKTKFFKPSSPLSKRHIGIDLKRYDLCERVLKENIQPIVTERMRHDVDDFELMSRVLMVNRNMRRP